MSGSWARLPIVRAVLPLLALGFAVVAALGTLLNFGTDRTIAVTSNVLINKPSLIDAVNSPSVVRNPNHQSDVVVAYSVDRPDYSALLQTTFDGGITWRPTSLPLPSGKDRPFGPDATFAPGGLLHVVYVNLTGTGNTPDNLWLATSTDGGRTLASPVRIAGALTFEPRVAVGRNGTVFVTWLQPDTVGSLRFSGAPPTVVAVHSTDGGKTFSAPARVSDPGRARVGAATPVVSDDGHVHVLYEDFKDDHRDFENLEGPPYEGTFALVLSTSTDGGRSFSAGKEIESDIAVGKRFFAFLPVFPSLAAGPGNALYAAWTDARNGDDDVLFRRSSDGGASWSDAARVNDNPVKDGTSQYLPQVSTSPGGRVDIVYLDRRHDPANNAMTDVFLATSSNAGGSFDTVQISDRAFDARVGPVIKPEFGADFGTRLGITSGTDSAVAVWADSRFGTETTGRQDIVGAAVRFPKGPPLIAQPPVILGFVVAGLAALAGWWWVAVALRLPTDRL